MGFFDILGERANLKRYGWESQKYCTGYKMGIKATIEALKEMMVERPAKGKLRYNDENDTTIVLYFDLAPLVFQGRKGTDNEEVAVLVVRLS